MRFMLPILLLLSVMTPGAAAAMDVLVGPATLDPALLAEELELPGTDEAAVLVIAGLGLDRLEVGFEPVDLTALPGIERNPPLLLRGLPEGLINLSIQKGDQSWDGQLRLFGGRVARLDADEVLRSAKARGNGTDPEQPSFDLFGFYDRLDEEPDPEAKLLFCESELDGLEAGTVDHRRIASWSSVSAGSSNSTARAAPRNLPGFPR